MNDFPRILKNRECAFSPSRFASRRTFAHQVYAKLTKVAGVQRISSHGARHTSGSSYTLMGASQKMIGTILGHQDTSATERYTHVQNGATRSLVEARWDALAARE